MPSLGGKSKPSPSSSGGGGGSDPPVISKPETGLEIEEMDRLPGDDKYVYDEEEEEEEEGENYRYGRRRGGGSAAYGLQPSSATSSIEGGQSELVGRKKSNKYPYAALEDVTALRRHPYARTYSPVVFSQRGSVMSADDNGIVALGTGTGIGVGVGTGVGTMRRAGLTTEVGRLSPIPSGPSLPSMSVPSVGGVGTGASAASGVSLVGAVMGGGSDVWDRGTPTGERAMLRNSMSTPDLRFTGGVGADQERRRADDGGSAKMKMRVWPRLGGTPSLKEKKEREREKEKEKERRWLSTQTPISILFPRPRFRVRTLEKGEAPAVAGQSGKHGLQARSRSLMDLGGGGGGEENAAKASRPPPELAVKRDPGMVDAAAKVGRQSYTRDDLSLLSLDK